MGNIASIILSFSLSICSRWDWDAAANREKKNKRKVGRKKQFPYVGLVLGVSSTVSRDDGLDDWMHPTNPFPLSTDFAPLFFSHSSSSS